MAPLAGLNRLHLSPDNLAIVEEMYAEWCVDPEAVDPSWRPIFESLAAVSNGDPAVSASPSFSPRSIFSATAAAQVPASNGNGNGHAHAPLELQTEEFEHAERAAGLSGKVATLLAYYRLHGHLQAEIDPLGRPRRKAWKLPAEDLTVDELDTVIPAGSIFDGRHASVRAILRRLKDTYTRSIGVEYMHIPQADRRTWLRTKMEWCDNKPAFTVEDRLDILRKLTHGDALEHFLHTKYVGVKRFSVNGGEAILPGLHFLIEAAGDTGVREIVIAMAHRGRLAVLTSVLNKAATEIFSEFERNPDPRATLGIGDVKYHMGFSHDHVTRAGDKVHLSLSFNPSHLEAVNPVALGRVRAKEDRIGDTSRTRALAVLLHGDAAFAGQGLVAETLQLSQIPGYRTGGAIHIVINNQIGFTTNPSESRSTTYATDVAHMLEVPIFHVNGNDCEAVVHVFRLAVAYRERFQTDVVIDLVCYRRYGHNEGDEPRFTQPLMYRAIDAQKPVRQLYAEHLVDDGIVTQEEANRQVEAAIDELNRSLDAVRARPLRTEIDHLGGVWAGYEMGGAIAAVDTRVELAQLQRVAECLSQRPDEVLAHRTVARLMTRRAEMGRGERPIDWGMGESLAFGTLLLDGHPVRVSGQDSVRGTFGHRHAAIYDGNTGKPYFPLAHLADDQPRFQCTNSMLSEAAVLGFDYGYSLDTPEALVIWEAQFGDFANNAQVVIDQFITSGEAKWRRLSGLVLLLPHGYAGQGPEHSSARLERFLQLCAMDNIQVCNATTPAQFFHLLRRQVRGMRRKPMVVMSPKSLLRHKRAVSSLTELSDGAFHPCLDDPRDLDPNGVGRVLLCSGKVYYDLVERAERDGRSDVAIVRVEQLYPLDEALLSKIVSRYVNRTDLTWVQEEPKNQGAWYYMLPRLINLFGRDPLPNFAGRAPSASPATGSPESHALEQELLLDEAFAAH